MMFILRFVARLLLFVLVLWVVGWFIERFRRRGPMPYAFRWMLDWAPRRLYSPAGAELKWSHIMPGDTVLELGPGTGFLSVEAASMVGEKGRLLCLDVQRPMLGDLSARLGEAGVANADLLVAHGSWLPLRDHCLDSAFLAGVLGEISDRPAAVAELRRAIRPGGVLSISEHLVDPDYQFEDAVRDLCRAVGFSTLDHHRRPLGYTMSFTTP